ncbi:hypothetical protein BD410DRAFT_793714 [Rickenella mellea]|uniref:Uncharacterized protein n=1 Tax=Rickenella mellea TaxID=50990 RepID=A0A4Y7PT33_9AGAM|nr:hypothetical protein BD410DRAFT_793714 [Rickenella mellea]
MSGLDTTTFPDRPSCFGQPGATNMSCTVPSPTMIAFLNITNAKTFTQFYCLNPPADSCAYGYCPNPDIASPAVRVATYIQAVAFSILILYSPDDIVETLYAQLLATYSLIISAIIAIASVQLTRLHAVFALGAAGSPLSLYLILYAVRSSIGSANRLEVAFGTGKILNRILVLVMLPLWAAVLIFIALPSQSWRFQQVACDAILQNRPISRFYYGPFTLLMGRGVGQIILIVSPLFALAIAWFIAIYLQRGQIWKRSNKKFPYPRVWRCVVDQYPFIQFCTVILFPSVYWIVTLEADSRFSREYFTPTYGQLLAIFAAVPALVQTALLAPRFVKWLNDLTWVRLITMRRPVTRMPRHMSMSSVDSMHTLFESMPLRHEKYASEPVSLSSAAGGTYTSPPPVTVPISRESVLPASLTPAVTPGVPPADSHYSPKLYSVQGQHSDEELGHVYVPKQ